MSAFLPACRDAHPSRQATNAMEVDTAVIGRTVANGTVTNVALTRREIDSLVAETDRLLAGGGLKKVGYPNMSRCGGSVSGYYLQDSLKRIDARFGAELGYLERKVYWAQGRIIRIVYREYVPDWGNSERPKSSADRVVFSDTTYIVTLGAPYAMEKMAGGRVVSSAVDTVLVDRLAGCGWEMRRELEGVKR